MVEAFKVSQVEIHGGAVWGLLTDFPKRPSEGSHHQNVGVALTANHKIDSMVDLKRDGNAPDNIVRYIKSSFGSAEIAAHEREPEIASLFPTTREERAKVEITMIDLYRSRTRHNDHYVYFFEAEKRYPQPAGSRKRDCDYDPRVYQGWITEKSDGALAISEERVSFSDCDGKIRPSRVDPYGIVTLKDRTFLFVEEHGWEDEAYTILELSDSGIQRVLKTVGP